MNLDNEVLEKVYLEVEDIIKQLNGLNCEVAKDSKLIVGNVVVNRL